MTDARILSLIAAGGELYADVRDQIQSGDLLVLHHEYVPSWYGMQIEAVQRFTGPFAHIAVLDRIVQGDCEHVVVWESVVPKVRMVPVSATAEEGFFWIPLNRPMTKAERDAAWAECGVNEYSKAGAMLAGVDQLPEAEDADPRRWCAKSVALWRRLSGVDLGARYVPTDMALEALNRFCAPLRYVRMK